MLLGDELYSFLLIRHNFQNIICIYVIFKILVIKKLENKIIILTKYMLPLKSKLYVQNYNSLHFYIYFYIFE